MNANSSDRSSQRCDASSASPAAGEQAGAVASEGRCPSCDDTGDVNSIPGEWRGVCHCPAGQAINARALAAPSAAIAAREQARALECLIELKDRMELCVREGTTAAEAYDSFYAAMVDGAINALYAPQCVGDPGECRFNGGCMYKCAALTQPTTVQQAGHCERPEGCVCGGDLPLIRERCGNWVKGGA